VTAELHLSRQMVNRLVDWQCLHVGNPTAKIGYFPSGTRPLKIDISRWEGDCERVPCYDLLTYLPHPNPFCSRVPLRPSVVLASRLQASYNPTPCPTELTSIYNTTLNFISVSFWTAYIISTFRVRVGLGSFLWLGFRVRVELYFGTGNLNHIR